MEPTVEPNPPTTPAPRIDSLGERFEVHNAVVDEELADAGLCGRLHLATGRACTQPARHEGGCAFDVRHA